MKRTLILALAILLSVSIAYMASNPNNTAYKVNQGVTAKIWWVKNEVIESIWYTGAVELISVSVSSILRSWV